MKGAVTLALLALTFLPAWASNPGEPLDCSDWVFPLPGWGFRDPNPVVSFVISQYVSNSDSQNRF